MRFALAAAILLGGCLGGTQDTERAPGPGLLLAAATGYACPPGATSPSPAGLCVRSFTHAFSTYEEPYLAVDPGDSRRMALGLNSWHASPLPAAARGGEAGRSETGRLVLFVTEDGGATWRETATPHPWFGDPSVGTLHWSGDPTLLFDERGVLHLAQLNVAFERLVWSEVQYASSPDLGRSWSEPQLRTVDGNNDRPWLTRAADGTLYVTWRNLAGDGAGEIAFSRDGGATWGDSIPAPDPCGDLGRVLDTPQGLRVACIVEGAEGPTGIRMLALQRDSRTLAPLADLPAPSGWTASFPLFPVSDARGDAMALVTREAGPMPFLALSADAGRSWRSLPLADLCPCRDVTQRIATWAAFDAEGALHILLSDRYPDTPDQPNEDNVRYAAGERSIWHVVVDPTDGRALSERRLAGPGEGRTPPTAGPAIGRDDYHTPAFWPGGGALVWTRDRGIDLTALVAEPVR